jgi:acyl carrier protein
VQGTWILHELTRERDLDFFVMFSSAASVWGSMLAGHYSAANHFEDVVAHHRRQLGLPALAVNWGWWSGSDMVSAEAQSYFASIGLDVLQDEVAFAALEQLLLSDQVQRTVAPVDWSRFKPTYEARRRRPLLELIEVDISVPAREASDEALQIIERLHATPAPARLEIVATLLEGDVAEVMGADPTRRLDRKAGFFEAGMDSVMSVELVNRLQARLGIAVQTTAAFEHPTVEDLARHILVDLLDIREVRSPDAMPTVQTDPSGTDDAAGLSEDDLFGLLADELQGT